MNEVITNPLFIRFVGLLIVALVLLLIATTLMRSLRSSVFPKRERREDYYATGGTAFHAYQDLIVRLKAQEQELTQLRENASTRAKVSESLSAAVLNNLGSGVVVLPPAGTVQQANPAAREILGFASPSGLHVRDLLRGIQAVRGGENDAASFFTRVESAAQASSAVAVEVDYLTPSGVEKVLAITHSPVRSNVGGFLGSACLISDLTEVTRLARQVQMRENLASLGEMSAGIAHEFKNSLATISGYSQMLQMEESSTVRDFAGRIRGTTDNLARIVGDLLNFARPKELHWEPIELRSVLIDCAQEAGVELDLAGFPVELTIVGDRTALRQSFSNLIRNSAEAVGQDRTPRVAAIGAAGPKYADIVLRDNGPGIPEDTLKNIFIPFFTTKTKGTGLGLALVYRIITQHGGSIRAGNAKDGAVFTLSLPLRAPGSSNLAAENSGKALE